MVALQPQEHVLFYIGDITTMDNFNRRVAEGKKGYGIQLTSHRVLDCYGPAKYDSTYGTARVVTRRYIEIGKELLCAHRT